MQHKGMTTRGIADSIRTCGAPTTLANKSCRDQHGDDCERNDPKGRRVQPSIRPTRSRTSGKQHDLPSMQFPQPEHDSPLHRVRIVLHHSKIARPMTVPGHERRFGWSASCPLSPALRPRKPTFGHARTLSNRGVRLCMRMKIILQQPISGSPGTKGS
jgi:hypothetical protein